MTIYLPDKFDDSRLPVGLGSPLKTDPYFWGNWGISFDTVEEYEKLVGLGEDEYRREWDLTTEQGDKDIAKASELAGYSNTRLNPENARVIAELAKRIEGYLLIVDSGAGSGGTSLPIWNYLDPNDKDRAYFVLVEPAKDKLEVAEDKLRKAGAKVYAINCTDLEMTDHITSIGRPKLVTGVASFHHHNDLEKVFDTCYRLLDYGGFLTSSEWHNKMLTHPSNVLYLLQQFEWPTKREDLDNFVKCYPKALEMPDLGKGLERKANEQLIDFWKKYTISRTTGENQFFILEGHRPSERYVDDLTSVGFDVMSEDIRDLIRSGVINSNPYQLLDDSTLHMLLLAQKPKKI